MITKAYCMPHGAFLQWLEFCDDNYQNKLSCYDPRNHVHSVSDDGVIFAGADIID
jgi:hypothetical protein